MYIRAKTNIMKVNTNAKFDIKGHLVSIKSCSDENKLVFTIILFK